MRGLRIQYVMRGLRIQYVMRGLRIQYVMRGLRIQYVMRGLRIQYVMRGLRIQYVMRGLRIQYVMRGLRIQYVMRGLRIQYVMRGLRIQYVMRGLRIQYVMRGLRIQYVMRGLRIQYVMRGLRIQYVMRGLRIQYVMRGIRIQYVMRGLRDSSTGIIIGLQALHWLCLLVPGRLFASDINYNLFPLHLHSLIIALFILIAKAYSVHIPTHLWKWGRYLKPVKFEHIFVAVLTFPPFFYANTFDTSLLLIVCDLRCAHAISVTRPLLITITPGGGGGFMLKKITISQLRV